MGRLLRAIFSKKGRASSRFSDFIRKASSAEKKKVYTEVMKKATERQIETARKARAKIASEQRPL
jgi:hypothetical protein